MARRVKISAGVLNIRLHPHSPSRYLEFMKDVYHLRKPVKLHGDRHGVLSSLSADQFDESVFDGVITTFLEIDLEGSWFNTEAFKAATDDEVSGVIIPPNLHPNSAQFYFRLDSNSHKIYFQTYSAGKALSGKLTLLLFQALARDPKIIAKYGEAQITLVQSQDGLDRIFSLKIIKNISITILKPNADIFSDDFEARIEAHLEMAQSKKLSLTYEAEQGKSIMITDSIKAVSEVALENGIVDAIGRDESGAVTRSTSDHPKQLQDKYDPDAMSEFQAFKSILPPRVLREN